MRVGAQRGAILARKPKIADLELPLVAVQDVAGLQISVQDPVFVQVVHPLEQLQHQALHLQAVGHYVRLLLQILCVQLFCRGTPFFL